MATLHAGKKTSILNDGESPSYSRRGGWITIPFILATMAGLTLSAGGWLNNLIVFLIKEFNITTIDAAQITNVVYGCSFYFPVIGAILADSFLGCFPVIWISSFISLMGLTLLVLTTKLDGLRPPPCESSGTTTICMTPSKSQYAMLYSAIALVTIGLGGTRFIIATMGANQFTNKKHQATFFNWYFITMYVATVVAATGVVYVEDNVSWSWGFGLCIVAGFLGLAMFLIGSRYYYCDRPQGSPFASLARVIVASIRKRKEDIFSKNGDYYFGDGHVKEMKVEPPTNSFRFLNRASLITKGDILQNGSIAKPWKLCTVEQVEDLKTLIKILPLWSTGILLSTPIGIQASLSVLQALSMNRNVGRHFQIPAGSILVLTFISTSLCLVLLEYVFWPIWKKFTGHIVTPLQQIGIGHVLTVASMAVSALVESKRRSHHLLGSSSIIEPISVLWLVPQLAIVGIGEAFHFPGQVALYYQEFPTSLKTIATAMISLLVGTGFYLSTALIDFVRRRTEWLPDNINDGRLDNMYWVLVVIGTFNFGYYLLCSWCYKYKKVEVEVEDEDEDELGESFLDN